MARSSKRNFSRENNYFSNKTLLHEIISPPVPYNVIHVDFSKRRNLNQIEDRRFFNPAPYVAKTLSYQHQLKVAEEWGKMRRSQRLTYPSNSVAFQQPNRIILCIRRNIRREVLHAKRYTARGRSFYKRPSRNYFSSVRC